MYQVNTEPLSPASTVGMPSPWVDREGGNNSEAESPTTTNWRTKFEGNWKDRMKYLLENNDATVKDVIFVVGPTEMEIKAHKFILAVSSIEFKNLFDNSDSFSTGGIILNEEDPKAFEFLIRYIYLDELVDLDKYSMNELHKISTLAEKYQFPNLHSGCIKGIQMKIESDWKYGLEVLQCEDLYRNDEIRESSINAIASNIEVVFKSTEFLNLPKRSLRFIIRSSKLLIKEIKVLDAATCWAKHQLNKRQNETRTDIKPSEIRSVLGKAIRDIRFPLFTVQEFLCTVTLHKLLRETDHAKILNYVTRKAYNVGNPDDPEWDTWPYIKEPRAQPPAIVPLMGPPNPPHDVAEEPPNKRQCVADLNTSNLNEPGTSTSNLNESHMGAVSQLVSTTTCTLPVTISDVSQPLTTAGTGTVCLQTVNSLKSFQLIRSIPSINSAIWEGILEWRNASGSAPTRISCAIHCQTGTVVEATNWAEKFKITWASNLQVSRADLVGCPRIFVVPTCLQSLNFLVAFLSQNHGIVLIPGKTSESTMAFKLIFLKKQKLFVGSIPKKQAEFWQEHPYLSLR